LAWNRLAHVSHVIIRSDVPAASRASRPQSVHLRVPFAMPEEEEAEAAGCGLRVLGARRRRSGEPRSEALAGASDARLVIPQADAWRWEAETPVEAQEGGPSSLFRPLPATLLAVVAGFRRSVCGARHTLSKSRLPGAPSVAL